MYSITYKKTGNCKLLFYYHMVGRKPSTLNIYTTKSHNGPEKQIFTKSSGDIKYWERAEVAIDETDWFQVIIEGINGATIFDSVSIDDIVFTDGCHKNDSYITRPTRSTTELPITNHPDCPDDYCQNSGVCLKDETNVTQPVFICKCKPGYSGSKCETHDDKKSSGGSSTGLVVGLLVPAIVIVIAVVGYLYVKKRESFSNLRQRIPFLKKSSYEGGISYSNMAADSNDGK